MQETQPDDGQGFVLAEVDAGWARGTAAGGRRGVPVAFSGAVGGRTRSGAVVGGCMSVPFSEAIGGDMFSDAVVGGLRVGGVL